MLKQLGSVKSPHSQCFTQTSLKLIFGKGHLFNPDCATGRASIMVTVQHLSFSFNERDCALCLTFFFNMCRTLLSTFNLHTYSKSAAHL